jgi:hypothetical protein
MQHTVIFKWVWFLDWKENYNFLKQISSGKNYVSEI